MTAFHVRRDKAALFQWVQAPPGDSLQPEATGAGMEETKCLKPSDSGSRIGDRASVQAATRVNAEQASKRTMCRPTRQPFRGRLIRPGEMSEEYAQLLHRGSGGSMYTRKAHATREAPDAQRGKAETMAAYGIPEADIARVLGVSKPTLRKHC